MTKKFNSLQRQRAINARQRKQIAMMEEALNKIRENSYEPDSCIIAHKILVALGKEEGKL